MLKPLYYHKILYNFFCYSACEGERLHYVDYYAHWSISSQRLSINRNKLSGVATRHSALFPIFYWIQETNIVWRKMKKM